jgi:predicted nucleic acid-binding protein
MRLVLDASAACELVLLRPQSERLDALVRAADEVVAPELYVAETANVLWKYVKAKELDLESGHKCLEAALNLCDRIVPMPSLIHEALVTSCVTKHPVYDAVSLILARRNGARLLTLDRKLLALARNNGVPCVEG